VNLTFLRTFVTLAREGSFTKTAKRLHMTQPGVSQHVAKLEEHFGAALVDRGAKGFALTEAGQRLLDHGAALLEAETSLTALVGADAADSGVCRFASPGAFGIEMYSFLLELNRVHRGLVVHYTYRPNSMVVEHVLDGSVDVGFATTEPRHAELSAERIDDERLCLVVPRTLADLSFQSLAALGFVDHPDGHHHASRILEANFPDEFESMEQLPVRAFNNQITRILEPVALGLGFTALPENAVRAFPQQDAIAMVPLAHEVVDPVLWVQRKSRVLPKRFAFIRAAFAEHRARRDRPMH
jgi:DNA-binding transcriptional LysR family regulator